MVTCLVSAQGMAEALTESSLSPVKLPEFDPAFLAGILLALSILFLRYCLWGLAHLKCKALKQKMGFLF
jgi:hypothetical protein